MSKRESLKRYHHIIHKLSKGPATFEQIADYLASQSGICADNFNISKRTFQRDINDILSLYNREIKYDFSKKTYSIDAEANSDTSSRMLEAFDIFNLLNMSTHLSDYIHFEKRKPQGTTHLHGILHAIQNKIYIQFAYQKYWEEEITVRTVAPYALKEFKNRWYVLALEKDDDTVKSYALDRISDLDILKGKIKKPVDFDVNEHYKNCFGIISPNDHLPEDVILSFTPFQGKYLKSLPLHESQKILIDNHDELRIQLKIFITHDFFMELLSYGEDLTILQPLHLIDEMKSTIKNIQKKYKK